MSERKRVLILILIMALSSIIVAGVGITVLYLTALDTPKDEQMRVQGVVYGVGALLLAVAHLKSGILNATTAPLSTLLLLPALLGVGLGFALQDRIDQALFRRLTLIVLVVAGLNLVRRGLFA